MLCMPRKPFSPKSYPELQTEILNVFWDFWPTSVNSKDSSNSHAPCVTTQDNMRFIFCSLVLQLRNWLENAIETGFKWCTKRHIFNVCLCLESVGQLMKREDVLVVRLMENLGGFSSRHSLSPWGVATGTAPGLVAVLVEIILCWKQRLIPQPGLQWRHKPTQQRHQEGSAMNGNYYYQEEAEETE